MKNFYKVKVNFRLLLIVFNLFIGGSIMAHEGAIKGSVMDSTSRVKVSGVTVYINETSQLTSTDLFGNYYFADVHPGIYTIKFSCIGYETALVQTTVEEGRTTSLNLVLMNSIVNLSEVVVSQVGEIGTSMNTISKLDIELRPTRSSQDILRMVPGLVTAQHAGGGKAEQIFLRGFDIDHGTDIRLSVDGMPVNMVSHAHGQGYADLHFLTPEAIAYVDFNKGPYYAAQGDFATAGYANFQTKNSLDRSSVKLEGGRFDSYRMVGMFDLLDKSLKEKNQSAYITSEYVYTNSYFDSPQNFSRINLMGKYHGVVGEDRILTASISTFTSKWEASGQIPNRAVEQGLIGRFGAIDNKEGGSTSRSNVNFVLTRIADNGAIIKNQLFLIKYNFELYSNFTFFLEDSINGDQIRQKESRSIYGYNSSYSKKATLWGKNIRSEIGIQLRYDDSNDVELSHTAQRKVTIDRLSLGQINQLNAGFYIDETINLSEKLLVNAAVRFDQFQFEYVNDLDSLYSRKVKSKNTLSPKLNFYYNVNRNFQIYLKTGVGFHSNDTRVVIADSVANTLPKAFGADFGIFVKPIKRLLINAAVWEMDLQQEFVYVGDAAVVEPSGYTRRYGFDLSLRYQVLDWLFADVDANFTVPRSVNDPEGENYIPLAPTVTSIGGLTANFRSLSISARYRHIGDRPANEFNTVTALGYTVYDAVINYATKKYAFGISMENILNVNWNEAQFDTESRLKNEAEAVSELHYTPGTPFFIKGSMSVFF